MHNIDLVNSAAKHFDAEIQVIEKSVNMIYACRWIPFRGSFQHDLSCLHDGLAATSCEDLALGDYNLPTCYYCIVKDEIETWYRQLNKTVGSHSDPRLPIRDINWIYFGKRLNFVLSKVKDKNVAKKIDWTKLAFMVRCYLIYLLSVQLTENLLKHLDDSRFSHLDLLSDYSEKSFGSAALGNCIDKITNVVKDLLAPDASDELGYFDNMTAIVGQTFPRNEMEATRFWGQEEDDEYLLFTYENETSTAGKVFGRMLVGKKKIVFNPLASEFVGDLVFDTSDAEYSRLADMGLHVGQTISFPTRRIKSENRLRLWDVLDQWPTCTSSEDESVTRSEVRFKCSVPEPLRFATIQPLAEKKYFIIPPIELI